MKTIKEWLKEGLKKEHYKIAKKNKSYDWNYIVNSFKYAMDCGVRFSKDNPVWNEIYINNGNRKKPKDLIVDEVRNGRCYRLAEPIAYKDFWFET